MTHEALKKRLEKLEEKGPKATVVVMWSPGGGIFGHLRVTGRKKEACSDEQEVEIMHKQFELDKHRIFRHGEEVSFSDYLEFFKYLGPSGLTERQRTVIDSLRGL